MTTGHYWIPGSVNFRRQSPLRWRGLDRFRVGSGALRGLAPEVRGLGAMLPPSMVDRTRQRSLSRKEGRKWARLHLAIPVFIRIRDGNGKDSLEFATSINISPGGALVAVRRSLPKSTLVSLEIPSAPIGPTNGLKTSSRIMQAKAVWVSHLDDYHLLGLKFARPLNTDTAPLARKRLRKTASAL
jgi:hypothetical protein